MPSTEAQRRAASKGWVVSTLDPDALTAGAELQSGLAIEVRHRDELGDEVIVPRAGPAPTGDDLVTSVDTQAGWTTAVVGDPSPAGLSPVDPGLVVLPVGLLVTRGGRAYILLITGRRAPA